MESVMRIAVVGLCLAVSAFALGVDAHAKKNVEPTVTVECHGKLRTGIAAIGGETTGTTITFHKQTWELDLVSEAATRFAEAHNKEPVTATGTLRKVEGTEAKTRWIVDVKTIKDRDPKTSPDGVTLTIHGTLKSMKSAAGSTDRLMVEVGKLSWPLAFKQDSKLQAKAEALIDKPITLTGTLEPDTDRDPSTAAPVLVKTLVAAE